MGHEIVYCVRCATRIAGTDFEKAKAFRLSGRAICAACLPELLPTLTAAEQQELSISSTRMRTVKEQSLARSSSMRIPAAGPGHEAAPPSRTPLMLGLTVGALVVIGAIAAMLLRSKPPEAATRPVEPAPVVKG